jgi:hypothetical protein
MSDFQPIADRVEIEALRGEFTDAGMMDTQVRGQVRCPPGHKNHICTKGK